MEVESKSTEIRYRPANPHAKTNPISMTGTLPYR